MIRKVLIFGVLFFFAIAVFGLYSGLKQRANEKEEKPETKAQEISITIVEGWNNKEIAQYLEKQKIVTSKAFLDTTKNFDTQKYESFLPKQAVGDLQGFLYPDTYRLFASWADRDKTPEDQASEQIIAKLLDNFGKKLPDNAAALAGKHDLSVYQAIILASIIEKETGRNATTLEQQKGLDEERKIIAGIFYNRLGINMALESDATVNYITGKNTPAVSKADTEIESPYNTYKYRGLVPKPICNPSLSSIKAALNPTESDYLYFLHDQETGKAFYAVTYEQHLANKQKYLR